MKHYIRLRLFWPIELQHLWELMAQRSLYGQTLKSEWPKIWHNNICSYQGGYATFIYVPWKRPVLLWILRAALGFMLGTSLASLNYWPSWDIMALIPHCHCNGLVNEVVYLHAWNVDVHSWYAQKVNNWRPIAMDNGYIAAIAHALGLPSECNYLALGPRPGL